MKKQKPTLNQADISLLKKTFATKDDLKREIDPLKNELKSFATKADLKNFATKDDLKSFATKDDLKIEIDPIKRDLKKIHSDLTTIINSLDREYLTLSARVRRIEAFLKIPPLTS